MHWQLLVTGKYRVFGADLMKFLSKCISAAFLSSFLFCAANAQEVTGNEVWIDVRTPEEFQEQHVSEALNIEFRDILAGITEAGIDKDAEILLYCGSGRRAGVAQGTLERAGFTNVTNVGGLEDALSR
jgi:phage shock protein E